LALSAGARFQLVYVEVNDDEQVRRVQERNTRESATTFAVTTAELRLWRQGFQVPDEAELTACTPGPSPPGYRSWEEWAAERWPTSSP
jgi:hypothetical protein